ncbi:MAG: phosphodiester glycosidase family protein [Victivallaceae bacterium]|nr:phosphodiester glycosidase family protein [Victivallaceae bacterium]
MNKKALFCLFVFCFAVLLFAKPLDWLRAKEVQSGVKLITIDREKPRLQKINVMRIDLGNRKLRFAATGRNVDYGKPMPDYPQVTIQTKRITTAEFVDSLQQKKLNVIVAANAAPWKPWTKPYTHKYGFLSGLNIGHGQVVSDDHRHGAVFLVHNNGKAEIWTKPVPEKLYPKLQIAVSGFSPILLDGKIATDDKTHCDPRMAYGLSKNRRNLFLITVDGRQPGWSEGATLTELAQLMIDAGASDALNMDGGGSTTLLYVDRGRKNCVMVNRHTTGGYARPVASNIAIYLEK